MFEWRPAVLDVVLKRFEMPDEIREFEEGRFEIVRLGGMTIGRATYQPGWRWSVDVGPATGAVSCKVEHVGMVISGCATAAMDDRRVIQMRAGDIFHIPPEQCGWDYRFGTWNMDLLTERGRRMSVDELNTTRLLAHARKQAVQRKLDDVLIVDVDAHHYENEHYSEHPDVDEGKAI
jgi:hypothetical protein